MLARALNLEASPSCLDLETSRGDEKKSTPEDTNGRKGEDEEVGEERPIRMSLFLLNSDVLSHTYMNMQSERKE